MKRFAAAGLRRLAVLLGAGALVITAGVQALHGIPPAGSQGSDETTSVTSFTHGHPEWDVLAAGAPDPTKLSMGHARHLNPSTTGMQACLTAVKAGDGAQARTIVHIPGADGGDGQLALSCASCHEEDEQKQSFRPIDFDRHCGTCHGAGASNSYFAQIESEELDPSLDVQLIHGPVERAVAMIDGAVLRGILSAKEPDLEAAGEIREELLDEIKTSCAKCHDTAGADGDLPFAVAQPRIPERWLVRSFFDHSAHGMMSCTECHSQAGTSNSTADVMLPGIASCRECHSTRTGARPGGGVGGGGAGGAPTACVTCHVYHKSPRAIQ